MGEKNYCSNCGEKLAEGANFCSNCGEKIEKENNEENEDMNFEDFAKSHNTKNENRIPKIVAHGLIGVISLILTIIGIAFFEEITYSAFGYYTPAEIEIVGTFLIGFLIAAFLILFIAVYAVKLNLLIHEKDKITWSDILLKEINIGEKVFSFISQYLLVVLINFVLALISFFIVYLAIESYYYALGRFLIFASAIIILIVNSRLVLGQFIVFDQKKRAIAALKKSFQMTKGSTLKIIAWLFLISIINSISGATVLGIFISFPISIYILTRLYYSMEV